LLTSANLHLKKDMVLKAATMFDSFLSMTGKMKEVQAK